MKHLPKVRSAFYLFLLLTASTGCYTRQDGEPFKELPVAALQQAVDESNDDSLFEVVDWIPENWWEIFDDPQLNEFIETTLINNPTLQSAKTKILLAITTADKVRSALYPTISWNADVQREKLSKTGVLPVSGTGAISSSSAIPQAPINPAVIPVYFTQYETALNILYDFDLWGKNRNTFKAALGEVQSAIADEAFTRLSLSIAVAEVYFLLQADYEQLRLLQQIHTNREHYFELVKKRVQYNLDDNLIFYAALNNLIAANQALLVTEANVAVGENQLRAYLAGDFQEEICDVHIDQRPLPKVPLPEALPLHLISHRPDIISKLWLIESTCYKIEVAVAGFYPDVNLMAFGGFQTIHLQKWFQAQSTYGDIQLATSLPIFTGGLLTANLRASEVNYDLEVLDYNQLIIDAVKQVLNGIVVLKNNNEQLKQFRLEAEDQQEIFRLTNLRIEHNIGSNLDYLNSENEFLLIKQQEVIALRNTLHSILELIKALGGGYDCAQ
jgi:NodT family efflux transporter outer membrane factor (OMF) lipoprotein